MFFKASFRLSTTTDNALMWGERRGARLISASHDGVPDMGAERLENHPRGGPIVAISRPHVVPLGIPLHFRPPISALSRLSC